MKREQILAEVSIRLLEEKYPHIQPIEGENLNIEASTKKIFTFLWADKATYPFVKDVALKIGLSDRTCQRMARKYNLPQRFDVQCPSRVI